MNVLVCQRVDEGDPVLYVHHDDDGLWSFLCGSDEHEDGSESEPISSCAHHVMDRDPALETLASMPRQHFAQREAPTNDWKIYLDDVDPTDIDWHEAEHELLHATVAHENSMLAVEKKIADDVNRYGLHIVQIPPTPKDDGFSFSVGLYKNYGHAEIIIFGQKTEWQAAVLNVLADEIKEGNTFQDDQKYPDIIPNHLCAIHAVADPQSYIDYVGMALWYYREIHPIDHAFPLLQAIWPDLAGRFPWDAGYDPGYRQPLLP